MRNLIKIVIIFLILILLIGGSIFYIRFRQRSRTPPSDLFLETDLFLENIMKITSSVFKDGDFIPQKYTCDGEDINPPLEIKNVPEKAKSLVLIVDDPDAPAGTWTHWLVWNINPQTTEIKENSVPEGAIVGTNDSEKIEYVGPCPPSGSHRYYFKISALDTKLDLSEGATREDLEKAMKNHVLAQNEVMARYSR